MAKLSPLPLNVNVDNVQLKLLSKSLELNSIWLVSSIAQPHQLVKPLVDTLQQMKPDLQIKQIPPLLSDNLPSSFDGNSYSLMIVVESGFHSLDSLHGTRRILDNAKCLNTVGLILAEEKLDQETFV